MSGFDVSPKALDSFARLLGEHGLHAHSMSFRYVIDAQNYTLEWIKLSDGDGGQVFQDIITATETLNGQIHDGSAKLGDACDKAAWNLAVSSDVYRKTDLAVAKRHDAAYKPSGVVLLDSDILIEAPSVDPASKLVTPNSDGLVPDLVDKILGAADWFSVGGLVTKILDLFGIDPAGWLTDRLLGNFDNVAKVKNALDALSNFDAQQAVNLAHGVASLRRHWDGHAAAAASSYFDQLANAMQARSEQLNEVKGQYEAFLALLDVVSGVIGDIISDIIDLGVAIGAEVAAAGCLAEVPGVNIIVGIVGAVTATRLYRRITDLADAWSEWGGKLTDAVNAITIAGAALGDLGAEVPIPKGAYYNPTTGPKPQQPDIFNPPQHEPTAFA